MCVIKTEKAGESRVLGHVLLVVAGFRLDPIDRRPKRSQNIELEIISIRQNDLGVDQIFEIESPSYLCRNLCVNRLDFLENEPLKPLPSKKR